MTKNKSLSQFFALVAVAGISIVVCTSCLGGCCSSTVPDKPQPSVSEPEGDTSGSGGTWTVEEDITIEAGSGDSPKLTIPADTKVTPKSAEGKIDLKEIHPSDIGASLPALPAGKKALAVVDVTPDGMTISPPAPLHFPLPSGHGYAAGDTLEIMQLDKSSDKWLPAGEAEVDSSEKFAVGEIAHTSVFALVEPGEAPTAVPVAARMPVASLLDDLDSMLEIGDYAAMVIYFPEEIGGETVDALTAYIEEQGYDGETFWGELPPGTDLSESSSQVIPMAGEYGRTVILAIDLSDSNNDTLVETADGTRAYTGAGPYVVIQMDTYAGEVTQLADID